jgi:hypothetical protein
MVGANFTVAAVVRTAKTVTAIGNAQVDTAQSKFGGSSLLLDGTDDRLEVTPTTTYDDFTVECWIRLANNSGTKNILSFGNESSGRVFFAVYNDRIYWDQYGVTSRYGNTSMSANTWYHLAWSRTGSTIKLFVDGVEQTMTTVSGSGTFPSGAVGNTNGIFIGTLSDGAIDFNGHIDEIRVSNIARYTTGFTPSASAFVNDANTLLLIHANGTDASTVFTDDNGARAQRGITALGNAQVDTAQSKFGGASALFDGTGDYLDVSSFSQSSGATFTFECWVRFAATPSSGALAMILSSSSGVNAYLGLNNVSGTLNWEIAHEDSGGGTFYRRWIASVSTNTWYHIALTKNGTTGRLFVDGTLLTPAQDFGTLEETEGIFTSTMRLGAWHNTTYGLNGHLDEIRISDIERYTTGFTAPTAPFVNDANTLLLIHANGTDTSTAFTDDNS